MTITIILALIESDSARMNIGNVRHGFSLTVTEGYGI